MYNKQIDKMCSNKYTKIKWYIEWWETVNLTKSHKYELLNEHKNQSQLLVIESGFWYLGLSVHLCVRIIIVYNHTNVYQ